MRPMWIQLLLGSGLCLEAAHRQACKISLSTGRNPEQDQALLLMAGQGDGQRERGEDT